MSVFFVPVFCCCCVYVRVSPLITAPVERQKSSLANKSSSDVMMLSILSLSPFIPAKVRSSLLPFPVIREHTHPHRQNQKAVSRRSSSSRGKKNKVLRQQTRQQIPSRGLRHSLSPSPLFHSCLTLSPLSKQHGDNTESRNCLKPETQVNRSTCMPHIV